MEELMLRRDEANRHVRNFAESLQENPVDINRVLHRFQLSFDATCILAQNFFNQEITNNFRENAVERSQEEALISAEDAQALLEAIGDYQHISRILDRIIEDGRVRGMHDNDPMETQNIFRRMPRYCELLENWIHNIEQRLT